VIEVDAVFGGTQGTSRGTAPATFMARMAQFEAHRKEPSASTAKKQGSKAKDTKTVKPRAKPASERSMCPAPPSSGGAAANASPRRSNHGNIGENVGLSEVSRTQPVALTDFAPLSDDERTTYAREVEAFGHDTVARSRAPTFQLRLAALDTIRSVFDELYTTGPIPALEATIPVLSRLVGDTVPKVAVTACAVFDYVLSQALFITEAGLEQLVPLFRALCHQLRDGRSKIYTAAKASLTNAAAHDSIGPVPVVDELCTASEGAVDHTTTNDDPRDSEAKASELLAATLRTASEVPSLNTTTTGGGPSLRATMTLTSDANSDVDPVVRARIAALGSNWKALGARLDVCLGLLHSYPAVAHGCTHGIMALGVAGLNCANSRVRRAAVVFVTEAYRTLRAVTEPFLKLVRAPNTMKLLREEIDVEIGDEGDANAAQAVAGSTAEAREEDQDLQTFDAEDTKPSAGQLERVAFWNDTIPHIRSLKCVLSSAWRLRRRALERVLTLPALLLARRNDDADVSFTSGPTEAEAAEIRSANRDKGFVDINVEHAAIALSQIVDATIGQHIPAVATASFEIAAGVLYSDRWPAEHKRAFAMPLVPVVLRFAAHDKVPDAAALAQAFLTDLAQLPPVSSVPANVARCALTTDAPVAKLAGKFVIPRTQCLRALVESFGTSSSSIEADAVMSFAVEALRHSQSKVRRGAVDLVLAVYKAAGNVVQEYLSQLAGPILDEVRERIQALAAKDRSRTAPSRRLATIVGGDAMLSPDKGDDAPSPKRSGGVASPPERPATIGASPPRKGPEFARTQGTSLRQRMAEWREAQQTDPSLADQQSPTNAPRAKPTAPSSASPSGVGKPPRPSNDQFGAHVPKSAPGVVPDPSPVFEAPTPQRKGKLVFA